jgi:tetratricopeptide (TPR) repeat protein
MGTPAYMAPEQFRGEDADGRTDLYALGITLYQMLAGKVPFESASTHGFMYQHLEKAPTPLRSVRPDLPGQFDSIVLIALEKSRERRFQSAEAMRAALAPFSSQTLALPSRPPDSTMVQYASTPVPSGGISPSWPVTPPAPAGDGTLSTPEPRRAEGRNPSGRHAGTGADGRTDAQPAQAAPATPSLPLAKQAGVPWPVVALLAAVAVFAVLVGGYLILERSGLGGGQPATPTTATGSTGGTGQATGTGAQPGTGSTNPAPGGNPSAACAAGLTTAANQRQQRALADAASTLEGLRASGCDVADPLYDVYLDLGRQLADDDRIDEAITRFDQALQVKSTDDARNARSLASTYRDGRGAIDRQSWDDAIQKLDQVRKVSPTYAKGNVSKYLAAALVGKGDDLRKQGKTDDALGVYAQAAQAQPGDAQIAGRIREAEGERDRQRTAEAASRDPTPTTPPPVAAPPAAPPDLPADLERVATAYYAAIDQRQYRQAYDLLSTPARQQQTLEQFQARFVNTRGISVRSIDGTSIQGASGSMNVHTRTVNATPQGDIPACSRVAWVLVREAGGWRRDVVSGSGNELPESC